MDHVLHDFFFLSKPSDVMKWISIYKKARIIYIPGIRPQQNNTFNSVCDTRRHYMKWIFLIFFPLPFLFATAVCSSFCYDFYDLFQETVCIIVARENCNENKYIDQQKKENFINITKLKLIRTKDMIFREEGVIKLCFTATYYFMQTIIFCASRSKRSRTQQSLSLLTSNQTVHKSLI